MGTEATQRGRAAVTERAAEVNGKKGGNDDDAG